MPAVFVQLVHLYFKGQSLRAPDFIMCSVDLLRKKSFEDGVNDLRPSAS